jgi:hypothetical protein
MRKPTLTVVEGGRSALERDALRAIFFDVPKFKVMHEHLKKAPVPGELKLVSTGEKCPDGQPVPGR